MSIYGGIAGHRGGVLKGIFLHNDAGGAHCTTEHYKKWLPTHAPELGFAHAYVCSDGILFAEDDENCAWHCGNDEGNRDYYSIEICQSYASEDVFLQNEEKAFQLAAEKCIQYGIIPTDETIRFHREVAATACPHRTVELHGGVNEAKAYCIQRILEQMDLKAKMANAVILNNTGSREMRLTVETAGAEIGEEAGEKAGLCRIYENRWGLYLTAAGGAAGDNVEFQDKRDEDKAQLWILRKKSYKNADYTMLESAVTPGLFLSVENNGQDGKENLKLWTDLHNMKQKFYIREETDGACLLLHAFTGKCVGAVSQKKFSS